MRKFIRTSWPILIIFFVVLFLAVANYRPGMILTGGDNLHTEFNFPLNIQRSLFSVWVEYEGLGVLAGMGHASDLVRQLLLLILSLALPMDLLRYVFTMATLFVGSAGAYYLIRHILSKTHHESDHSKYHILHTVSLLGALFYLLNLATLQQYYTPFEVFTVSFASLPWLFLVTINFFQKQSVKNLLLLSLVLFLTTPQAVVPTVFIVWLSATGILTLFLSIKHIKPFALSALPFAKFYLLVFLINAFWLLPFAFFVLTNAHVDVNAKINQMGSENIYALNKEFGNITDVMLLRGFWFQNVEPDFQGNITYMMLPWRVYMNNPLIPAIGYFLFTIVIVGLISAIHSKKRLALAFAAIFFFAFLMLTTATPPFAQLNDLLRAIIPLFKEVFRFPFTKFSTLLSLMYAIFFAYGAYALIRHFTLPKLSLSLSSKLFALCLIFLLGLYMLPAFQGAFIYEREKAQLPKAYKDLFARMQKEDPSGRVALFPANTFWDWKFYSWGYSGSGFLWYGIRQPILDRAFDMWGKHNENYYHELSQALYSKNPEAISNVLSKYDIKYLIVDDSVIYPSAPQSLLTRELPELFAQIPSIKKSETFDAITLYTIDQAHNQQHFVSLADPLPSVNAALWNNNDVAYASLGDYISYPSKNNPSISYPFRSLYSGKNQEDKSFTLTEEKDYLNLEATLRDTPSEATLILPSYIQNETVIPALLTTETLPNGQIRVNITVRIPEVLINDKKVAGDAITRQIALLPNSPFANEAVIDINGLTTIPLRIGGQAQTMFLSLEQENVLTISDMSGRRLSGLVILPEAIKNLSGLSGEFIPLPKSAATLSIKIPKITDNYLSYIPDIAKATPVDNCNIFRKGDASASVNTNNGLGQLQVQARNATSCTAFFTPNLPHDQGYGIFVTAKNQQGKPFHFWLVNEDEKFSPIDTYLPKGANSNTASFVLPPQDAFGISYSFHLDNVSIGNEVTKNTLEKLSIYQLPYRYLTNITIDSGELTEVTSARSARGLNVTHPNETLYTVTTPQIDSDKTLILSQSYDSGWHLYSIDGGKNFLKELFPSFFGSEVVNHVMVNGWANGWGITPEEANDKTFVIIFLPQYLQYVGFILFGLTVIYLIVAVIRRPKHQHVQHHT